MALTWVSSSPHITKDHSVNTILIDYIFALFPTLLMSLFLFGFEYMLLVMITIFSSMLFEMVYDTIYRQKFAIRDASSIVTGLMIALCLPPGVPFYVPIFASVFAILFIKMIFGGFGSGVVSEVAIVRIFVAVLFADMFSSSFVTPEMGNTLGYSKPLIEMIMSSSILPSFKNMIIGNVAGGLGETTILTLIMGGIYLCIRRVIDYKVPLIYLTTVAVLVTIFKGPALTLPYMMSSGLVFVAFFVATDFGQCPDSFWGSVLYSVFLGGATMFIWTFGDYLNAPYYAVLFAGVISSIVTSYHTPKPYGMPRRKKV